jgi:hypothetical protein
LDQKLGLVGKGNALAVQCCCLKFHVISPNAAMLSRLA